MRRIKKDVKNQQALLDNDPRPLLSVNNLCKVRLTGRLPEHHRPSSVIKEPRPGFLGWVPDLKPTYVDTVPGPSATNHTFFALLNCTSNRVGKSGAIGLV